MRRIEGGGVNLSNWWRGSLKVRLATFLVAALTTTCVVVGVLADRVIGRYLSSEARDDQELLVESMVPGLSNRLEVRFDTLQLLALDIPALLGQSNADVQAWLDRQPAAMSGFNRGVFITDARGLAVASWPKSAGRVGINYSDRDYIVAALRDGSATIGMPVIGRPLGKPVLLMSAPVRDNSGQIVGAIVGVTDLGRPSFLNHVIEIHGQTKKQYHLVDSKHRVIISSTDSSRTMEKLPVQHEHHLWDELLGSNLRTTTLLDNGVSVLATAHRIPPVDWHLVVTAPTEAIFAPLETARLRVVQVLVGLIALGFLVVLWILRHALKPVTSAAQTLELQNRKDTPKITLPVVYPDEIGSLVTAFNTQLTAAFDREETLRVSELALQSISQGVVITDSDRRILKVNPHFLTTTGYSFQDVLGRKCSFLQGPETLPSEAEKIRSNLAQGISYSGVILNYRKNGEKFWNELAISPLRDRSGAISHFIGITRDVTARYRAEELRRISATAFESQEGIFITDANQTILQVNRAFTRITGYTNQEVVGKTPRILSSGRHDRHFYASMWSDLLSTGIWRGEIWNRRKSGELFPESLTVTAVKDEAGKTTHYVANLIDIGEQKLAEETIKRLAYYDPLTQLPNRRLLKDRLKHSIQSCFLGRETGAVIFVDLDNFKSLNDTRGHHHGDQLLQQAARRLESAVREGDTVARLGGDEFVILLEGLDANTDIATHQTSLVGQKVLEVFRHPYTLEGGEFHCSGSLGITLFGDRDEPLDDILKRADLAMYQAKSAGRNTLRFFSSVMQDEMSTRVDMEHRLRQAIHRDELELHYQPLIGQDGEVVGAEALLRWIDRENGPISPATFIPMAEQSDLIFPMGRWVLDEACRTLKRWSGDSAMSSLTLSVNVSAKQFQSESFVDDLHISLQRYGTDPNRLKIEITESVVVNRIEDVISKMLLLSDAGIRFSVDDFGTGYSSLSYLKRLPIEELKIDASFVRDVLTDGNDAAIAEMVLALASTLGLSVVAEGVETEDQRQFLASKGCPVFQGYLFSRPLNRDALRLWIESWNSAHTVETAPAKK